MTQIKKSYSSWTHCWPYFSVASSLTLCPAAARSTSTPRSSSICRRRSASSSEEERNGRKHYYMVRQILLNKLVNGPSGSNKTTYGRMKLRIPRAWSVIISHVARIFFPPPSKFDHKNASSTNETRKGQKASFSLRLHGHQTIHELLLNS